MKVVYFVPDITNPFWREVVSGIEKAVSSERASLEVVSCGHDKDKQRAQLQDYASHHPDAVLLSPVDLEGITPLCKIIVSSGKPVVAIDLNISPYVTASVISGNMKGGLMAASHIADRRGSGARVVHIKAEEHLQNVRLRSSSFAGEAGKRGLLIVERIQADSSREVARSKMAEFLKKHVHFDAVFAENDNMAIGAVAAIEAAQLSPYPLIVGYDGTAEAQALIRLKKMDASISQNATMLGQKAFEVLSDAVKGKAVTSVVSVLPYLVTAAELK